MSPHNSFSSIGALVSWNLQRFQGQYYTFNVHFSYLKYMAEKYEKVYLISSVKNADALENDIDPQYGLSTFENVEVVALPEVTSSARALIRFCCYFRAIKRVVKYVDLFYCRVPDPFSWMPRIVGKKKTIMHFVGDTIDTTKYNEKWSPLKKMIMIAGYKPEWWLTLRAARKSKVYCNGYHLVERLAKHRVKALPVVSSTVSVNQIPDTLHQIPLEEGQVTILFLSYIRYAKGINCLMDLIRELNRRQLSYKFIIVGDGEMMPELKEFVHNNDPNQRIDIKGHINSRYAINEIMHRCDLFFFSSLSEGSPRVIIEAASQGLPILSTPVGSLPYTFTDRVSIRFFPFNDANAAAQIIQEFLDNSSVFDHQRNNAHALVKERYTIESFLSQVFNYEE